jgi:hypothetical protein
MKYCFKPVLPWEAMTIRSTFRSEASFRISSWGFQRYVQLLQVPGLDGKLFLSLFTAAKPFLDFPAVGPVAFAGRLFSGGVSFLHRNSLPSRFPVDVLRV